MYRINKYEIKEHFNKEGILDIHINNKEGFSIATFYDNLSRNTARKNVKLFAYSKKMFEHLEEILKTYQVNQDLNELIYHNLNDIKQIIEEIKECEQ